MQYISKLKKYRNIFLLIIDTLIIIASYFIVYFFKDQSIFELSHTEIARTINTILLAIIIYELFLVLHGMYLNITRFESGKDYLIYGFVCAVSSVILSTIGFIFNLQIQGIRTNLLAGLIIAVGMITYRLFLRIILTHELAYKNPLLKEDNRKKLLIIGAGEAAKEIIKSVQKNMNNEYNVIGVIDDNKNKHNYSISGVKILGNRNKIEEICKNEKIDEIFFAISKISKENKKQILNICQNTGKKVKILPGIEDIIRGKKITDNLRDVEIEDLLGREPIKLDNNSIEPLIKDRVVLVTGGGGSIGSELCRQIIQFKPKTLVMLDIYENTLYDIEMELRRKHPDADIKAVIASIRDKKRLDEIFEEYKPYLVFHAAAHKHVPLMEVSPLEAIHNNIFGTYNVVNCCDEFNVKRFILISTDKAVNPTNIMGATKRMCEMIVQAKDKVSNTEYAAVRFGNVLGSNGSVIPLFKKQIAEGGPVTVTHKEITRYFMTIPEAVSLVIQAMTYAEGGEIFVLDMGEPVKIYDLATSLIKLSGYEPNVDIKIKITGLRAGEKLYEELLMSGEGLEKTKHQKIFVAEPMDITIPQIEEKLNKLNELNYETNYSVQKVKDIMKIVVPTYHEPK